MASDALVTQGTMLEFTPTEGSPPAAVAVSDATGWTGPSATRNEIDVTNLASTGKEWRLGLPDYGTFAVDVNWNIWDDPGQAAAWDELGKNVPGHMKVTYSNGKTIDFDVLVATFEQTGGTDDKVTGTINFRVTGAINKGV